MPNIESRYSVYDGDTEIAHGVTLVEVLNILADTRRKDVPGQEARLYFKNVGYAIHINSPSGGL